MINRLLSKIGINTVLWILLTAWPVYAQQQKVPQGPQLAAAALYLTTQSVKYDPTYFAIPYPNGDVPAGRGVCTDVVIRAYRRRVPNLMKFFSRHGRDLAITRLEQNFEPGDIVCWDLGRGITHIGLVVNRRSSDGKRNLIVHNIGAGQVLADCLFKYRIIGHYRY